jgi:hypothetical protein
MPEIAHKLSFLYREHIHKECSDDDNRPEETGFVQTKATSKVRVVGAPTSGDYTVETFLCCCS